MMNTSNPFLQTTHSPPAPQTIGSGSGGGVAAYIDFIRAIAKKPPVGFDVFSMGGAMTSSIGDEVNSNIAPTLAMSMDPASLASMIPKVGEYIQKLFSELSPIAGMPGKTEIFIGQKHEMTFGDTSIFSDSAQEFKLRFIGGQEGAPSEKSGFRLVGNKTDLNALKTIGSTTLTTTLVAIPIVAVVVLVIIGLMEIVVSVLAHFCLKNGSFVMGQKVYSTGDSKGDTIDDPLRWEITSLFQVMIQSFTALYFGILYASNKVVVAVNALETAVTSGANANDPAELASALKNVKKFKGGVGACLAVSGVSGLVAGGVVAAEVCKNTKLKPDQIAMISTVSAVAVALPLARATVIKIADEAAKLVQGVQEALTRPVS